MAQEGEQRGVALSEAGQCWAEVWCGPPDSGRWVAADPLAAWLDEPSRVRAAPARLRAAAPLAYVAAFSGGGAKDVTQRCTGRAARGLLMKADGLWSHGVIRDVVKYLESRQ